ncbi:MAG: LPS biosynthesis glycosyltransferase [Phormidesmis sp.]
MEHSGTNQSSPNGQLSNIAKDRGEAGSLVADIGQTFVIAYREPTEQLTQTLSQFGLDSTVLRQVHQPGYETYSPSFLCLLNHRCAWEKAVASEQPTLIVEADFVPVQNFATLPPPYNPADPNLGIAWLYTCAPQVYNVVTTAKGRFAQGYSTSMVAYVVSAKSAQLLIELAEQVAQDPGPTAYSPWDSGIEYYLRDRGLRNYVPFRNYGEHGGAPNPEHKQNKLSKAHRADVLYGKLAFSPMYAQREQAAPSSTGMSRRHRMNRIDCWKGRAYGRIKGLGRLLLLKYLRGEVVKKSEQGGELVKWAITRQLTL